jgi:DNA helicase-2/ATP-dependent DNA helicase PcrA
MELHTWLLTLRDRLLGALIKQCRTVADDGVILTGLIERTKTGNGADEMTVGRFCGHGDDNERLNLSTLHSSKGREFPVVILFGMDNGKVPRSGGNIVEARRLFYVGFTRAAREVHMVFSRTNPSPFVVEVQERLEADS